MRRYLISSILLLAVLATYAAGRTVERTYIMTDRPYYAAGEKVYCSLFCTGPEGLSSFSSIAYLELSSSKGLAATAKVALLGGRGAGYLVLPSDLPTGNYSLIAYTAVQKNETSTTLGYAPRIISVYNASSSAKVDGGVTEGDVPAGKSASPAGPVTITVSDGMISLTSDADATLSISVSQAAGLPDYDNSTLTSFLAGMPSAQGFTERAIPEYDGEIVTVTISDRNGYPDQDLDGKTLYMASPGTTSDLYSAQIKDGKAVYYTGNIYGDKNVAFSLAGSTRDFQVSIDSPFEDIPAGDIPDLVINPSMREAISSLGVSAQLGKAFRTDTLMNRLPARNLPFTSGDCISYNLDDYTRFTTMQEIFTEFLFDIRARRRGGEVNFSINCSPFFGTTRYTGDGTPLILIDGVPVMDHKIIYNFDPLLIKRIDIYPRFYTIGIARFEGVANFVTYKGDMAGANLGSGSKILGFQGVSYPESLSAASFDGKDDSPKLGKTILWHPLVDIEAGTPLTFEPLHPDYQGSFNIIVEGLTADGRPVYATARIDL